MDEERVNNVQCQFERNVARPSALEIHSWIKNELKLPLPDVLGVQLDIFLYCLFLKLQTAEQCDLLVRGSEGVRKFRYFDGTVTNVSLSNAGFGIRDIRVFNLPFETKTETISRSLTPYGTVMSVTKERWSSVHDYPVANGIHCVRMVVRKHVPSFLLIHGHRAFITYNGQPQTCAFCSAPGHFRQNCPKRLRPMQQPRGDDVTYATVALGGNLVTATRGNTEESDPAGSAMEFTPAPSETVSVSKTSDFVPQPGLEDVAVSMATNPPSAQKTPSVVVMDSSLSASPTEARDHVFVEPIVPPSTVVTESSLPVSSVDGRLPALHQESVEKVTGTEPAASESMTASAIQSGEDTEDTDDLTTDSQPSRDSSSRSRRSRARDRGRGDTVQMESSQSSRRARSASLQRRGSSRQAPLRFEHVPRPREWFPRHQQEQKTSTLSTLTPPDSEVRRAELVHQLREKLQRVDVPPPLDVEQHQIPPSSKRKAEEEIPPRRPRSSPHDVTLGAASASSTDPGGTQRGSSGGQKSWADDTEDTR